MENTIDKYSPKFVKGQFAEIKEDVFPESEFWDKGYWKIKKGSMVEILMVETSSSKHAELDQIYLVEYIDASFWIKESDLIAIKTT